MTRATHAAILLAAGGSRRLGAPKQLVTIDGETLVRRAALALLTTDPVQLYVVVGAMAESVYASVADLGVRRVECLDWSLGLSASLRAGIGVLPLETESALVALCDQPALDAAHLARIVQRSREHPDRAVASAYDGVLGVPALLPRSWFADIATLHGDVGARELLRRNAAAVEAVDAPALAQDVDEPGDEDRIILRRGR
jgi:CTP:molybdopterin cytidylyltransferase MocA